MSGIPPIGSTPSPARSSSVFPAAVSAQVVAPSATQSAPAVAPSPGPASSVGSALAGVAVSSAGQAAASD